MNYFQILDETDKIDITKHCSDYALATYLHIIKSVLDMVHIIAPIILIVMATIQLIKLMTNPDDSGGKGKKSLYNKFIAAVILFLIPYIVNVAISLAPGTPTLEGCWEAADEIVTIMNEEKDMQTYSNNLSNLEIDDTADIVIRKDEAKIKKYTKKVKKKNKKTSKKKDKNESIQNQIVTYAKSFVGNEYKWGGYWSGEKPYQRTDCSGFVKGIYNHFGYKLPSGSVNQAKVGTAVSSGDIKKGDLVFYGNGVVSHVAMYIGEGKIVHASSSKPYNSGGGVKISNNYKYRNIIAIRRIVS